MLKKAISLLISAVILTAALSGCTSAERPADDGKINVVCTIFPQYDWAGQIIGEDNNSVNLTLLLDNGIDLHNYQPTAEDIITISECDIFVYVGGESDKWVDEVIASAENKDIKVINMMEVLGESVREEEIVEGMEGEDHDHEDHEDHDDHEEEHSEEPEYDEHVWLSLKNAKTVCSAIADALCETDSANSDAYKSNVGKYISELDKLDGEYRDMVDSAARKTILVADRFPFRYLADDYGLDYYAAFVGCSAETEASFETVIFLAGKADELSLPVVFAIDGSDMSIAKTVVSNTLDKDKKILTLNSLQSVTISDIEKKTTYLTVMRENFEALKEALN